MKEVKSVGFPIPSEKEDFFDLDSYSSLDEVDIVVFMPSFSYASYSTDNGYTSKDSFEGKKLYNKESSVLIRNHSAHWQKELSHFVERGGTLFVILCNKEEFYIHTGTNELSGTGKSQKVTNIVTAFSNYHYLPFGKIQYNIATGNAIVPKASIVADLYSRFKDLFSYNVYLSGEIITEGIFTTKKGERVLGAALKYKKGHLVYLPNIHFNYTKFYLDSEGDNAPEDDCWTVEAKTLGKVFINSLVEIEKSITGQIEKSPKPTWAGKKVFQLSSSTTTFDNIQNVISQIEEHNANLQALNRLYEEQESLKDLLFETGKPLELAVIQALKILGYKAENYDDGVLELDQIILSPEGDRMIGECEGKENKDIDVSKFRQLLDGLNADYEKEDVAEKASGILFGNAQRLIEPSKRTLDFTQKCRTGAKREKIGLIKTSDLFTVCKVIIDTQSLDYAKVCRDAIKSQLGELIKFPEYVKDF